MRVRLLVCVIVVAVVMVSCGGPRVVTERRMVEWAPVLNLYMGTNAAGGNSYPESLDEMPAHLTEGLERTDGWGNPLLYRLLRIDKYNLISAGPDGELGNADDVVLENSAFYDAEKIYAENPLKR